VSPAREQVELGQFFLNEYSGEGARKAVQYFEAAAKIDPDYAPAYAGLANAHNLLAICRRVMLGSELDWSALAAPGTPVARR
jgi:hypothetical protein